MHKGLGIAAFVIAILSVIIPFYGPFLTIIAAALAAFSYGPGFTLGMAAIILNCANLIFMSPSLWVAESGFAMLREQGGSAPSFASFIVGAQVFAFVLLFFLNKRPI